MFDSLKRRTAESAALLRLWETARLSYRDHSDAELRSWAAVARAILNLDEVVTRE